MIFNRNTAYNQSSNKLMDPLVHT